MKIIDKVKTIFWDNEDEEMDEVEEISPKKSKEQETEIINERDLFKTETNFKFPVVFTEEDFAKTIPPEKHISTSPRVEKNKIEEAKKQQETSQIKKQEPIKKSPPSKVSRSDLTVSSMPLCLAEILRKRHSLSECIRPINFRCSA